MFKYIPQEFEKKWAKEWVKNKTYKTKTPDSQHPKTYTLAMFPYPSGSGLHVGHVRIYTGTDVLARYFRMLGYAVLNPMGWDAFGLPAENAAIKERKNPMDMVPENIANFKRQMIDLGFSFDWDKEFSTTDPSYYQWTQWLFIQFFKMGLLYKKDLPVYYCPFCKTGLAEEEVLSEGTHERCGKPITRKTLPQWVFRITSYADRLLEDLKGLDWPQGIIDMQKNWIGRSEGAEIQFKIDGSEALIKVFTTRPDTLFGATAVILAPEHELIKKILQKQIKIPTNYYKDIQYYVREACKKLDLQRTDLAKKKTGVFTGLYAVNPVNGEKIPIWVADYVLGYYGHGAVMLVPAHDERDFEFAQRYGLPIKWVITPKEGERPIQNQVYTAEGYMIYLKEVEEFFGDPDFFKKPIRSADFREMIVERLKSKGIGKKAIQYKLRDWIFSRQRYWGEPIPIVYCEKCARKKITWWDTKEGQKSKIKGQKLENEIKTSLYGLFPLPEDQLPLKLPYVKSYEPSTTGESPLAQIKEWTKTVCPVCQGPARRETDTMPNWAGSCWYFIRFAQNQISKIKNQKEETAENFKAEIKQSPWLPVDWYLGGAEHAVLHLLYSRFWVKAMLDLGLLSFSEPFTRLRNVGMVLASDRRKMSKSFGNVINPDEIVAEYGADTLRLYEMFMAPFNQENAWSTATLQGAFRFLTRVWKLYHEQFQNPNKRNHKEEDRQLVIKLHRTIARVTKDLEHQKFNTAIAAMMEFVNDWEASIKYQNYKSKVKNNDKRIKQYNSNTHDEAEINTLSVKNAKAFLQILAPFAPFITEEIWRNVLGEKESIHLSSWPQFEAKALLEEKVRIPVQVNGRLRAVIIVLASELSKEAVVQKALTEERVKKYIGEKEYKEVYIPGKILNFVLKR